METQISTRALDIAHSDDRLGSGFAGSFLFHIAVAVLLLCWAWLIDSGHNWGQAGATSGAIQATMVASLPFPSTQPPNPNNVLATDTPSPAPITSKAHTVEAPSPDAIPIPTKSAKPLKPPTSPRQLRRCIPSPTRQIPTRCRPARPQPPTSP